MTQRTRANVALPQGQDASQERTLQEQIEAQDARLEVMMNLIENLSAKLETSSVSVPPAEHPAHDAAPRPGHTPRVPGPARTPLAAGDGEGGHGHSVVGFQGARNPQLIPLFSSADGGGGIPWDSLRSMGHFPQKPGWESYIPLGGPLAVLEPCWVAAQGRTLGATAQEFLWPQLVPQADGTDLGKTRNPQALYTSLEGFAKGFMEAAALCGPGVFPSRDVSLVAYSASQWHQERSLTAIARRGLMRHPAVHAALEAAPSPSSLRDLLAHAEKVLRVDTRQDWITAAAGMQALQMESLEKKHLLDLRAQFQTLAIKLRHTYSDAELRNQFLQVCLRLSARPGRQRLSLHLC